MGHPVLMAFNDLISGIYGTSADLLLLALPGAGPPGRRGGVLEGRLALRFAGPEPGRRPPLHRGGR